MGLPGGWSKGTRGDWSADGDVGAESRQKVGTEERSREGPKSKLLAFMRIGCGDSGLSGATFPVLVAAGGAEPWPAPRRRRWSPSTVSREGLAGHRRRMLTGLGTGELMRDGHGRDGPGKGRESKNEI